MLLFVLLGDVVSLQVLDITNDALFFVVFVPLQLFLYFILLQTGIYATVTVQLSVVGKRTSARIRNWIQRRLGFVPKSLITTFLIFLVSLHSGSL